MPEPLTPGDVIRGCVARCEPCSYRRVSGDGVCDNCRRAVKLAEAVDKMQEVLLWAQNETSHEVPETAGCVENCAACANVGKNDEWDCWRQQRFDPIKSVLTAIEEVCRE